MKQAKMNELAKKIMVALDYPNAEAANKLLQQLDGIPCYVKVGMELFYAEGPNFVRELKAQRFHVFLDLKLHDIPNTVKKAAASISRLGVDLFNVHAAGGKEMMAAAMEGAREGTRTGASSDTNPHIIAVTQLTSTNQQTLNAQIGIPGDVASTVLRYAKLAQEAGLHGVVASSLEVGDIKAVCGRSFMTVTPGIRPSGSVANDQKRVMTPKQALAAGSDYLVIGRPITQAENPREALQTILEEMSEDE